MARMPWYSNLNAVMTANYNTAKQYYLQREKQFQAVVTREGKYTFEEFTKSLSEKAQSFHPNVTAKIYGALSNPEKYAGTINATPTNEYEVSIHRILESLQSTKAENRKGRVKFIAGGEFEKFLEDNMITGADQAKIGQFIMEQIGDIQNAAWATAGKSYTRTDVGFRASSGKIGDNATMELTKELNLEDLSKQISDKTIYELALQQIIDQGVDTGIFGFQVKTYKELGGSRWMNSAAIFERINSIFHNGKTWSSEYATLYPSYYLSKYLINIINPVNIGIIYGGGIEYTSSFLDKYRFYMEVTYQQVSDSDPAPSTPRRGGGWEVYPSLASNLILMHQLNNKNAGLKPVNQGELKHWAHISGKDKKIKVATLTSKS